MTSSSEVAEMQDPKQLKQINTSKMAVNGCYYSTLIFHVIQYLRYEEDGSVNKTHF